MCIRVQFAPRRLLQDPWDRSQNLVTLPETLHGDFALRALRFLLDELGTPQPESGALCWCGEPIRLLPRVPQQRRSGQVMTHGA